ncbi:thioesterase II family protein [Streptomyces sp. NPDC055254]
MAWLRRFDRTEGGGPRLICFPHAGGAASAYLQMSRALTPAVEVHAVQYPGRQDRRLEPPLTSIPALATALADTLVDELALAPAGGPDGGPADERPYAFFGHSMGAAVAYETTRLLAARGARPPERLFLSARGAPTPEPRPGDRLRGDAELIAGIRRLGGTGSGVLDDPEVLEIVLPALRGDYEALGAYSWQQGPPLDVPFTVLVGTADPVVPVDDARGWLGHSTRPGEFLTFEGGHFYLDGHLPAVTGAIRSALRVPSDA